MSLKQQAEAVSMKQEPERKVNIEKQAYELSVLRNGLERLRHDNNWQGVDDVNGFIDKLLAVK